MCIHHLFIYLLELSFFFFFSFLKLRKRKRDCHKAILSFIWVPLSNLLPKKITIRYLHCHKAIRDGNGAGQGGAEGWDLRPRPAWIFLAPSLPRPAWQVKFLTPSPPLKAPRSPALPRKTLFLINFPYNYYHFFK